MKGLCQSSSCRARSAQNFRGSLAARFLSASRSAALSWARETNSAAGGKVRSSSSADSMFLSGMPSPRRLDRNEPAAYRSCQVTGAGGRASYESASAGRRLLRNRCVRGATHFLWDRQSARVLSEVPVGWRRRGSRAADNVTRRNASGNARGARRYRVRVPRFGGGEHHTCGRLAGRSIGDRRFAGGHRCRGNCNGAGALRGLARYQRTGMRRGPDPANGIAASPCGARIRAGRRGDSGSRLECGILRLPGRKPRVRSPGFVAAVGVDAPRAGGTRIPASRPEAGRLCVGGPSVGELSASHRSRRPRRRGGSPGKVALRHAARSKWPARHRASHSSASGRSPCRAVE